MPSIVTTEIDRAALQADYRERRQLASALGISPQYLSGLMTGHRTFTPDLLDKAIEVLKVPKATAKRWHRLCAQADGWRI